ncbi:tryptophan-rich sensory protein [Winogradskyella sp. DF17]|uniref:Tryptophan-rich sensory protein n=1 Tax=Winogradskyella pelagia TaxID=2819984 RepID=A0ABS3T7I2_9FLAO|nr:tryptophan-rich sensory protein [Winogradskyella sp. DF17]MBO3117715.1 tryptophan-rich sensory protein [Winogradskyella sp. DF17]
MKKTLQIANGLALGSTIFINYLSNTGVINNTTIGKLSDSYKSLFTPAGYTFSIWGLIYLLLLVFVIYQGRSLFVNVKEDRVVEKTRWWFVWSCVFNSLWVFAWLYEYTLLSCVFIFLLLFSLFKIIFNNQMESEDDRFSKMVFVSWPIVIYAGWVTVASIANVSSYLVKSGWGGFGISPTAWTITMIAVAVGLNLFVMWKRHMRGFVLVGAWALVGIGAANSGLHEIITTIAFIGAAVLITANGIHGFLNFETNPYNKFKKWKNEAS